MSAGIQAPSKIMHGAKAKIAVNGNVVGIFTSVTYGVTLATHVAHILGKHAPAAITYTAQEAVNIQMTGFRVIGQGPYSTAMGVPQLKDLMSTPGITIQIIERKDDGNGDGVVVMQAVNAFITNFSTGVNARSISDVSVSMLAERLVDETATENAEAPNATDLNDK